MDGMRSVVVCGGGIAGISFAASLIHSCKQAAIQIPQITILEKCISKDSKINSREYTITLRETDTLSFLGIQDKVKALSSPSQEFYVAVYDWGNKHKKYISVPSNVTGSDSMRVKMKHLYNALYSLVVSHEDLVKVIWNTEASSIQIIGEDKVKVITVGGTEYVADIVVVADGHKSALRTQLIPEDRPNFTNMVGVAGIAQTPDLPAEVLRSHGMTIGTDSILWLSHEDKDSALWAMIFRSDRPLTGPVINRDGVEVDTAENRKTQTSLRDLVLSRFGNSYPALKSLVPLSPLPTIRVINGYDKIPREYGKKYKRVVLIGDASHPVTPMSGIGASMALVDAKKLALALTSNEHADISAAIHAFERDMIKRTSSVVKQGRFNIRMLLSSNPFWVYTKFICLFVIGWTAQHFATIKRGGIFVAVAVLSFVLYSRFA